MIYTEINARVTDQTVQLINEVELVSGSRNVYRINCSFCHLWDGTTKTAVFYRTLDDVYPKPLENDSVVVPPEVVKDKGDFFFGIFGINGEQTRPTETLRFTVKQGAITSATVVPDPTPGIYEQLIQLIQEKSVIPDDTVTQPGRAADAAATRAAINEVIQNTEAMVEVAVNDLKGDPITLVRGVHYGTDEEIPEDLPEGALWLKVVS